MKKILNIILIFPLFAYLVILLINNHLITQKATIDIFFSKFEINIITYISIFFILYLILIYSFFRFSNYFIENKKNKLVKEINKLKAEILDKEPKFLEKIEQKFNELQEKNYEKYEKEFKNIQNENLKLITTITHDYKIIKEKLEKINSEK